MQKIQIILLVTISSLYIFTACKEDIVIPKKEKQNNSLTKVSVNQISETITIGTTTSNTSITTNPTMNNKLTYTVSGNDFGNNVENMNLNLRGRGPNNANLPRKINYQTNAKYKKNNITKTVSFQDGINAVKESLLRGNMVVADRSNGEQIDWNILSSAQKRQKFVDWGYQVRRLSNNNIEISKELNFQNNNQSVKMKNIFNLNTNKITSTKLYRDNKLISEQIVDRAAGVGKIYSKVYDQDNTLERNNFIIIKELN